MPRKRKPVTPPIPSHDAHQIIKAWAVLNDNTGRLVLRAGINGYLPAIHTSRKAANEGKEEGERVVRIAIYVID